MTTQPERRDLRDPDLLPTMGAFYEAVEADPMLRGFFADLDMEAHLPRIVDFWSTIVFGTQRYQGNAFAVHQQMEGLTAAHFTRWLETLESTLDARFAGPKCQAMKSYAHRIAYSMQLRLGISPESSFGLGGEDLRQRPTYIRRAERE